MNRFVLALALMLAAPACATVAAVAPHLPTIIAAVTDGLMVLDAIESFIDRYYKQNLDAASEAKVRLGLARARGALNTALRVGQGAEKLDRAQVDEAFAEFRVAYLELLALVGPLGVQSGDRLAVRAGSIVVPEPLAIKLRRN